MISVKSKFVRFHPDSEWVLLLCVMGQPLNLAREMRNEDCDDLSVRNDGIIKQASSAVVRFAWMTVDHGQRSAVENS